MITFSPQGMVFNIFTTCVVGFIFLLILLLNTGDDIDSVINTQYGNATIGVFVNSVGLNNAVPLTALIVIISYMAGLANMTITARIGWAMARDGSFPCSPWLRKINPVTKSPVNMVLAILIFDYILLLIPLGSTLAFSAISNVVVLAAWSHSKGAPPDFFGEGVTFLIGSLLFATTITVVANVRVFLLWSLAAVTCYVIYALSRDIPLYRKLEAILIVNIFLSFAVYLNWEIDRRAREIFATRQLLDIERDKTEELLHKFQLEPPGYHSPACFRYAPPFLVVELEPGIAPMPDRKITQSSIEVGRCAFLVALQKPGQPLAKK